MKSKITFQELENHGYVSVTDYCRVLIQESEYPETLEVYREDMLCLTVDVDKAALIEPATHTWRPVRVLRRSKGRGLI